MTEPRSSADRVRQALRDLGLTPEIREFGQTTRTSADAAAAIGCSVAQIAKSLVFRAADSGRAILVIAAGDRRVNETKLASHIGESIERAPPDLVRAATGFAIGGVAPLAHPAALTTFVDTSLRRFEVVWAAGGTPHTVFPIAPADLYRVAGGTELDVA